VAEKEFKMASTATRRANAARKATTAAVANKGTARRGRPVSTDVLARFTLPILSDARSILAAFMATDAPVAPVAPDVAAIVAANTDADGNTDNDAVNAAIAERFAYAANYAALVAAHDARNASARRVLAVLDAATPVSRKVSA
jgi:hypothetical protein